jgi:hypothetical protein
MPSHADSCKLERKELKMNRPVLTEEQIWKLLEGHHDVLTPLAQKESDFLKRCPCPNCGKGDLIKRVNSRRPFTAGSALPNMLLYCDGCEVEFDPYSKMVTSAPASMIE